MTISMIPAKLLFMFNNPEVEPSALVHADNRETHGWINFYHLDEDDESNGISVYVHFEKHPQSDTWEGAWDSNPYEWKIVKMERIALDSPLEADSVTDIPVFDLEDVADLKALVLSSLQLNAGQKGLPAQT